MEQTRKDGWYSSVRDLCFADEIPAGRSTGEQYAPAMYMPLALLMFICWPRCLHRKNEGLTTMRQSIVLVSDFQALEAGGGHSALSPRAKQ